MKKLLIMLVVVISILAIGTMASASGALDRISGAVQTNSNAGSGLDTAGAKIINILQTVATVVAIAILLFVGIKFMMAAPSEKANLKGALIPYIVGAVLIFAAIPVVKLIQGLSIF